MRTISLTSTLVLLALLSSCNTTRFTGPGTFHDDIYFVPGKDRTNIHQAFSPVPSLTGDEEREVNEALARQVDEFMRSERAREQEDLRDFSGLQEEYISMLGNEEYADLDTLIYYNEETGYWVHGFRGSEFDRNYAERIIRFHRHSVRVPYFSPFFSEVVFFNHFDWNVYVDRGYAYVFPTWTNRWYDHFFVNRWFWPSSIHLGWHHGWGWGWGSPFHGIGWWPGWGHFGPGFGWSFWHHSHWHWHHPHFFYPPYFGFHHWPVVSPWQGHRGMRSGLSSDTRGGNPALRGGLSGGTPHSIHNERSPRQGGLTGEPGGSAVRQPREVTGGAVAPRSPRVASDTHGQVRSVSPRAGASDTYSRDLPTRRSYTPSYRQPDDNSRPVYNRPTHTRVVDRPRQVQTTGTVQGGSTGTRQVQGRVATQNLQGIQARPATGTSEQQRMVQPATTGTRQTAPVTFQRGSSSTPAARPAPSHGGVSAPSQRISPAQAPRSASPSISTQPSRSSSPSVSPASRSSSPSFSSPSPSRSSMPAPSGGSSSPAPRSSTGGGRR